MATGQNDYYPLYLTNGLVTNGMRRAHRNAITLIGFLAIPKSEYLFVHPTLIRLSDVQVIADREFKDDAKFRTFRRELFHTTLRYIMESVRPYMTTYDVVCCGDGYYRRFIYNLGPYIADYPEQVLLACIVQGWCPRYV